MPMSVYSSLFLGGVTTRSRIKQSDEPHLFGLFGERNPFSSSVNLTVRIGSLLCFVGLDDLVGRPVQRHFLFKGISLMTADS